MCPVVATLVDDVIFNWIAPIENTAPFASTVEELLLALILAVNVVVAVLNPVDIDILYIILYVFVLLIVNIPVFIVGVILEPFEYAVLPLILFET